MKSSHVQFLLVAHAPRQVQVDTVQLGWMDNFSSIEEAITFRLVHSSICSNTKDLIFEQYDSFETDLLVLLLLLILTIPLDANQSEDDRNL